MHQKLIDELFAVRDELQAKLSLSEKRAEELAIELVHEHAEIEALAAERDSAKSSLARVVEALPVALELIEELRAYASEQWDWKYGERWNSETEVIRSALHRSQGE